MSGCGCSYIENTHHFCVRLIIITLYWSTEINPNYRAILHKGKNNSMPTRRAPKVQPKEIYTKNTIYHVCRSYCYSYVSRHNEEIGGNKLHVWTRSCSNLENHTRACYMAHVPNYQKFWNFLWILSIFNFDGDILDPQLHSNILVENPNNEL